MAEEESFHNKSFPVTIFQQEEERSAAKWHQLKEEEDSAVAMASHLLHQEAGEDSPIAMATSLLDQEDEDSPVPVTTNLSTGQVEGEVDCGGLSVARHLPPGLLQLRQEEGTPTVWLQGEEEAANAEVPQEEEEEGAEESPSPAPPAPEPQLPVEAATGPSSSEPVSEMEEDKRKEEEEEASGPSCDPPSFPTSPVLPLIPPLATSTPSPTGPKRRRISFSMQDVAMLEVAFRICRYPGRAATCRLGVALSVDHTKVTVWFQNRRARRRKNRYLPDSPLVHWEMLSDNQLSLLYDYQELCKKCKSFTLLFEVTEEKGDGAAAAEPQPLPQQQGQPNPSSQAQQPHPKKKPCLKQPFPSQPHPQPMLLQPHPPHPYTVMLPPPQPIVYQPVFLAAPNVLTFERPSEGRAPVGWAAVLPPMPPPPPPPLPPLLCNSEEGTKGVAMPT